MVTWPVRIDPRAQAIEYRMRDRAALWFAQHGICPLCGDLMPHDDDEDGPDDRQMVASIEHVIPRSLGGFNRLGNYVATHRGCNRARGDAPPTGCLLVWLLAVNARLCVEPVKW